MRSKSFLHNVTFLLVLTAAAALLPTGAPAAPKYTILHGFTGGKDGGGLWGSLTLDSKGNVYGTNVNIIFELSPSSGGRWDLKTLYEFDNHNTGGGHGGLIFDRQGNLYGSTPNDAGPYGFGLTFQLAPGPGGWKFHVLHRFGRDDKTAGPLDRLALRQGKLYGAEGCDFSLTPARDGWKETILYCFPSYPGDGSGATAGPVFDRFGNLYGTTAMGGTSKGCGGGCGTAYELSPQPDGKWKEHILHDFYSWPHDGIFPGLGALAIDSAGNLYGTTDGGGELGWGTVYELAPGSDGKWKETILHSFAGGAAGDEPSGGVVMDQAGNLYGTTIAGGSGCGCGLAYKLAPAKNGKWTYTILHTFVGSDGAQPDANLILDKKGNLYGTTATGGPGGYGVAFELTP